MKNIYITDHQTSHRPAVHFIFYNIARNYSVEQFGLTEEATSLRYVYYYPVFRRNGSKTCRPSSFYVSSFGVWFV